MFRFYRLAKRSTLPNSIKNNGAEIFIISPILSSNLKICITYYFIPAGAGISLSSGLHTLISTLLFTKCSLSLEDF